MLFDSLAFVLFFVLVFFLYFSIPTRLQKWLLLLASCYFYMVFIPKYILILFFLITVDYVLGRVIEQSAGRKRMLLFLISIFANIGTLFFFKYFTFFNQNLASVAHLLHWNYSLEALAIALPIGLSFHTFQSLAYVIEVYRGRVPAERNYATYALYVMFFPQLVAGPIERPGHLLPQLQVSHSFNYGMAMSGLRQMFWGFFKKIVIANNIALLVNFVYGHVTTANGSALFLAVMLFAIQLYADFSGYSDIALGSARMLGIELSQNFNRPYFSQSIAELWRRWHISLSSWFRDYVYTPLIWHYRERGAWWTYAVIVITFLLTGVWHGAGWNFVMMGFLFGFTICLGIWTKGFRDKLWKLAHLEPSNPIRIGSGIISTFILTAFLWVFFRATSLTEALLVFKRIFSHWDLAYLTCHNYCAVYTIGISKTALLTLGVSIVILFLYEMSGEYNLAIAKFFERRYARVLAYYALILWMLLVGYFAPLTFIYFQF